MRVSAALSLAGAALVLVATPARAAIGIVVPPTPVVLAPVNDALLGSTPIAFNGTIAEPGDAIVISEGGVPLARVDSRGDGTWATPAPPPDGPHTFDVTAEDAVGTPSAPATVNVTVDTTAPAAPAIDSPADGSAQRSTTVTLSGRAEPGANVAVAEGTEARGEATADATGAWSLALDNVAEGAHAYTATARDTAGHTGPASAARNVRVDLTPPPAPEVSGGPDGFTVTSAEAGAALACSLDASSFEACASGVSYPGLGGGEHLLAVRAPHAAGNASTTEHRFTVAHPPAATPTPAPPTTSPTPAPVVAPSYRKTVVLRPQAGRTLIRRAGETAFSEIRARTAVAVGTSVDVKQGTVIVVAATPSATETAKFSGGVFTASGTDLTLSETLGCGRARRLTGDGAGAFRIRGRYASATGRGATWTVEDTCKQTRIRVARGVVAVRDTRRPNTILIRSGRSYTARPKR